MAVTKNFEVDQNATFAFEVQYTLDDETTPIDITNCSAKMQIRPSVDSSVLLGELSTANGRIILTGAAGKVELSIPSTDTGGLVATKDAVYDLEIYFPARTVRLIEGKVTIKEEVTRG